MKSERIEIKVEKEIKKKIQEIAKKEGFSKVTPYLRECAIKYPELKKYLQSLINIIIKNIDKFNKISNKEKKIIKEIEDLDFIDIKLTELLGDDK